MEDIKTIFIPETDSTNSFLRRYSAEEGRVMTVVWTDYQTAGRGQGSNVWESERGENLTFSVKVKPTGVATNRQYVMLEAGALAVKGALDRLVGGITIKWPNDIYWHDRKISGTLSECSVHGAFVKDCILGIGLNVNQSQFVSDAPNPISLRQITGLTTDRETLLHTVTRLLENYLSKINAGLLDDIHLEYCDALYRRTGFHPYRDAEGEFSAEIVGVETNGHLRLRDSEGRERRYAFKEIEFII